MRDSATQIEDQIDKSRNALHQNKMDLARLKGQLNRADSKDPSYVSPLIFFFYTAFHSEMGKFTQKKKQQKTKRKKLCFNF